MDEFERASTGARRTLALAHGILNAAEDVRNDLERALAATLRAMSHGSRDAELARLAVSLREMIDRLKHEPAAPMREPLSVAAAI